MFTLATYINRMISTNYPNKSLYGNIFWWLPLLLINEKYCIVREGDASALIISRGDTAVFGLYNFLTKELVEQIISQAKTIGLSELRGPVHVHTIFAHQLPIQKGTVSDVRDRGVSQEDCRILIEAGFSPSAHYTTYYRSSTRAAGEVTTTKTNKLSGNGYSLTPIKKSLFNLGTIKKVLSITNTVFAEFHAYTHISLWKFIILSLANTRSTILMGIYHKNTLVGYFTYYTTTQGLHIKTIAIDPGYQGQGLTNLVIHHTHTGGPVWYDTVWGEGEVSEMNRVGLETGTTYAQYRKVL